jgi:hypothetical protein
MPLPRRILLLMAAALLAATMALMTAGPALAQELEVPHQHVLTVPGTGEDHQIARGTGKCGANLTALNNFHSNVHVDADEPIHPLSDNLDAAATTCPEE